MATQTRGAVRKPARAPADNRTKVRSLAQELSEVLEVMRRNPGCFPQRAERTKISVSLATGERLDLEIAGASPAASAADEHGDTCLGHEFETTAFRTFASIDDLGLGTSAKAAAEMLLKQFPEDVKFTSGRRSISAQAAAMAPNIVKNRKWVEQTYKNTPQRAALQKWVDDHPAATSAAAITTGLEGIFTSWTEAQQRNFSRHITGDAFDVQPVAGDQGEKIKEAIAKLPKLNWHTFEEGGLAIWHAQFDA
jgi:hypothetical protein